MRGASIGHGTNRLAPADGVVNLGVAASFASGNFTENIPHQLLKSRALNIEQNLHAAGRTFAQQPANLFEQRAAAAIIASNVGGAEFATQFTGECRLPLTATDRAQPSLRRCDQARSQLSSLARITNPR